MKFLKTIPFLFLAVCFSCKDKKEKDTVVCLPHHLENGVIAFYPFGNGSLQDRSIYNNHLSNTNASPTEDRNGNAACAYQFDNEGSNTQFLSHPDPVFLNGLSSFSISLWYKNSASNRGADDYEGFVSRGPFVMRCGNRRGEWSLGAYDRRIAVFGHENSVWATQVPPSTWNELPNGYAESLVWHHVVAIKNNQTYQLYFDAVLQGSKTGSANCNPPVQDIGELFIGREFTGKLDDILIYNRGLSAAEVTALYQQEACCE